MEKKRGQGVVKISGLFEKYKKKLRAPQGTVIKVFQEVVQKEIGLRVLPHQCSYTPQTQTLTLRVGGSLKTEVLLRREQILKKIQEELGEKSSPKQII